MKYYPEEHFEDYFFQCHDTQQKDFYRQLEMMKANIFNRTKDVFNERVIKDF